MYPFHGLGSQTLELDPAHGPCKRPLSADSSHAGAVQVGGKGCGKSTFIKCLSAALKDVVITQMTLQEAQKRERIDGMRRIGTYAEGTLEGVNCQHHFRIEVQVVWAS